MFVSLEIVTLAVVIIGTVGTLILVYVSIPRRKVKVSIRNAASQDLRSKMSGVQSDDVIITVANRGNQVTKIDLPTLIMHDGKEFDVSPREYTDHIRPYHVTRLPINCGKNEFPHMLIPGDVCEIWTSHIKLAHWLVDNGYDGAVAIKFSFPDKLSGRKYVSDEYTFNSAETSGESN